MGTPPNTSNSSVSPRTVSRLNAFGKSCKVTITCQGFSQIRLSKGRLIWLYRSLTCTSFSELSKGYTSSYCEKKLQSCFYKFDRTKSFRNLLNCQTVIYFCITCNTSCLASLTFPNLPNFHPFFLPKALQCSSIGDMVATVVDPLCVEGTGDVTVVTVTAGFFRRLEALVDSATAESPETNGCLAGMVLVFSTHLWKGGWFKKSKSYQNVWNE